MEPAIHPPAQQNMPPGSGWTIHPLFKQFLAWGLMTAGMFAFFANSKPSEFLEHRGGVAAENIRQAYIIAFLTCCLFALIAVEATRRLRNLSRRRGKVIWAIPFLWALLLCASFLPVMYLGNSHLLLTWGVAMAASFVWLIYVIFFLTLRIFWWSLRSPTVAAWANEEG